MPRKKASHSISEVLTAAELLRNKIASLSAEVREDTKKLALAIVNMQAKRRGRPPGKKNRPRRKRGRPRGRRGRPPGRPRKVGRPPKAASPMT
jgi:hypothetical protein